MKSSIKTVAIFIGTLILIMLACAVYAGYTKGGYVEKSIKEYSVIESKDTEILEQLLNAASAAGWQIEYTKSHYYHELRGNKWRYSLILSREVE